MPLANVSADWSGGDLIIKDASGNTIFQVDGTNRKVVFPSGSVLDVDAATTVISLADDSVTAAKAAIFVSAETTGTGSAQNVAHGLGVVPAAILVVPTEHPGTPDTGAFDIAEGTHTTTNVVLTVTANVKFKVFAWA